MDFRLESIQSKKRQVIPNIIDINESLADPSTTVTATNCLANLDAESITQTAAMAASIAAMNVINQPFVKIHSELEEKIVHVIRQLDNLKEENKTNLSLKNQCVNPNYNEQVDDANSKLKYLERVQDSQFQLISELIQVMGKEKKQVKTNLDRLNETCDPRIKPERKTQSRSLSNMRIKRTNKSVTSKKQSESFSRARTTVRPGNKENENDRRRSTSNQSGCSTCDNIARSRSRRDRSVSTDYAVAKSTSRSRSRSRSRCKNGEFLQTLLDSSKSPVRNKVSTYEAQKNLFNKIYPDTLFDKYLVSFFFP